MAEDCQCGAQQLSWPNYGGQDLVANCSLNPIKIDPASGYPWTYPNEGGVVSSAAQGATFIEGGNPNYSAPASPTAFGPVVPLSYQNTGTRVVHVQPVAEGLVVADIMSSTQHELGLSIIVNNTPFNAYHHGGIQLSNNTTGLDAIATNLRIGGAISWLGQPIALSQGQTISMSVQAYQYRFNGSDNTMAGAYWARYRQVTGIRASLIVMRLGVTA